MECAIWGGMADRPALAEPIFEAEVTASLSERPVTPRAFAMLIFGNVMLAIGPWFVRLSDLGPVATGFWRLALAFPFIAAIALIGQRRGGIRVSPALWGLAALAGLFFAADLGAWHAGILRTKLANTTLFGNISSFFFPIYGFILVRSWPNRWQTLAIALALAGTALLLGRSYELSRAHLIGDLLCLAAGVSYFCYMIAIDRVRERLGTWPTLALATLVAAVALLPASIAMEGRLLPGHWGPLFALAIGSQVVGQGLLVYSIGALPPVVVGLGLLSQPLVAAAIGWTMFGERMTIGDMAGAAAIAAALVLVRRR
jgi:drug/metabolite transporter (DMT)-like permease